MTHYKSVEFLSIFRMSSPPAHTRSTPRKRKVPLLKTSWRRFCPVNYATDHRRLLLHTEVMWLSKENCLKRFMELFEPLSEFM